MTLRDLLQHPSVDDVVVADDTIYLILSDEKNPPTVYSDKSVISLARASLLASEHLPEILQGKSLRHGKAVGRYRAHRLYEYSTENITTVQRQSIAHQLYGTGGRRSLIEAFGGRKVGRSAFIVPERARAQMDAWLKERQVTFSSHKFLMEVDE